MNGNVWIDDSPCYNSQIPCVNLDFLKEDKMVDQSTRTIEDNSQKTMDLESHLRGLILSNGMLNADPSVIGHSPINNLSIAEHKDQGQIPQSVPATAQPSNSGKPKEQNSRKQPSRGQRRQPCGQNNEHQHLDPSNPPPGNLSKPPNTQSSSRNRVQAQAQAQRIQNSDQASYGQLPLAGNGGRLRQPGFQGVVMNPGPRRDDYLTNEQPIEPRQPHANARINYAMPNTISTVHADNHNLHRPLSAQHSQHGNTTTRNQNHYAQYPRPIPQNRQLYEPGMHRPQTQHRTQNSFQMLNTSARTQALFLEQLSSVEIPKAAISPDELREKEALRLVLEEVCRKSITEYERKKDNAFDEKSVALKCFGSLASGFATHSADMDLALVSPHSKPESSSPESEIPRLLEKALLDLGYGVRLLTRTRVPIIKFCEKPTTQLAAKLLEERAKFEKERDAPTKPRKAKTTAEPKQIIGKGKGNRSPITGEEAPTIHAQTTHLVEAGEKSHVVSQSIINDDKVTNTREFETFEAAAAVDADIDERPKEIPAPILDEIDDAKINQIKPSVNTDGARVEAPATNDADPDKQKLQKPTDNGSAVTVEKEKVTDLAVFSDEELVRLYDLAIKEGWYEPAERAIIMDFKKAVGKYGPNSDDLDLQIVRSDLQTLTDVLKRYRAPPEHHLDFPKAGVGIQCDINFSNQLALHNTRLLKCYGLCDQRVRPMVLFVKAWAKRRKINSPYHGTLSSYGYVLMVLHYLVNVAQPSIAPNLQTTRKAMQDSSPENDTLIDGYQVRFWRNEAEIMDLAKRGMLTHNRDDTIGSLLRGFFQYYAQPHVGFSWATDVISIRTDGGLLSKAQKGWTGAKTVVSEPTAPGQEQKEVRHRYLFAIEDPFEVDHNIARTVVHNGIVAIRDEFRRAHAIIQSAGFEDGRTVEELFAEAESKENLQYRAFGPLPRKDNVLIRKDGKAVNDLRKSVGEKGASTHTNGEGIPGLFGKAAEAKVVPKAQILLQKPTFGPASPKDGTVSKLSKAANGKLQDQANSGNTQVVLKTQNLSLKSSVDDAATKDKDTPVQQEVGNSRRSRNKGGKDKVPPKKGPPTIEQAATRAPAQGRSVGAVFKNGKEIIGSSGRVGDAGVIPSRPSANTK